jgi:DNA-directed RNA polymerase specialized sigma subunit
MKKEEARNIYLSLNQSELSEDISEVLNLYLLQNKSFKESATILNLSVSATKQKIAKALFTMRKITNDPEYLKARKILYGN